MTRQNIQTCVAAIAFAALPGLARADTYLLMPGVAGDVTETAHRNWIRLLALDWGVTMPVASTRADGGGTTVSRAYGDTLKLTIATGSWSRELLNVLPRGIAIPQIIVDHVNPDGRPAYRITFGNVVLSHYSSAPTAKSAAQDEIECVVGSYKAEYYAVGPDGTLKTTTSSWNFITNTGT